MRYEAKLDGLRAYAAFAVIGMHWRELFPFGWVGVQFFFVLSGYLITSILAVDRDRAGLFGPFAAGFFRRRALRLLPLYYAFCLVLVGSWLLFDRPAALGGLVPYMLTYTMNLARMEPHFPGGIAVTHLWSLAVEMQFYLVWPVAIWSLGRDRLKAAAWVMIAAGPLFRLAALLLSGRFAGESAGFSPEFYRAYFVNNSPLSHLDAFGFGALLALPGALAAFRRVPTLLAAGTLFVVGGATVLALGRSEGHAGFLSLGYPACMPHYFQAVWGYSVLNFGSACLIAWSLGPGRWPAFLFGNRVVVYLGTISYGIYLWHFPIVAALLDRLPGTSSSTGIASLSGLALATGATIAAAAASRVLIEKPFLNLKSRRPRPAPIVAVGSGAGQTP